MTDQAAAHATLRLAMAVLVVTALAGVWEVLAAQAPGSLLYLGVLPGPVQALRESALWCGVLTLVSSLAWSRLSVQPASSTPRRVVFGLHAGVILSLGASAYGATQGMRGEQLFDLRTDGMLVFALKYTGHVLYAGALLALGLRLLRALRPS
ncbi:MAG: hypothetical protein HYZ44_00035 [Bacteroidetes bacterium]|nr:hypothetical protein [Bacteroidota bacterium]